MQPSRDQITEFRQVLHAYRPLQKVWVQAARIVHTYLQRYHASINARMVVHFVECITIAPPDSRAECGHPEALDSDAFGAFYRLERPTSVEAMHRMAKNRQAEGYGAGEASSQNHSAEQQRVLDAEGGRQ